MDNKPTMIKTITKKQIIEMRKIAFDLRCQPEHIGQRGLSFAQCELFENETVKKTMCAIRNIGNKLDKFLDELEEFKQKHTKQKYRRTWAYEE